MDKKLSYPYSFLLVVCLTDLPWCKTNWLLTGKINKISPVLDGLINYIKTLPY